MKIGGKLLITLVSLSLLSACSYTRNIYLQRPEVVGEQPKHLMPTKKALGIEGPVKSAHYYVTRQDFTGSPETRELTIEFNEAGYVTKVTGDERLQKTFGMIQYANLPENSEILYYKDNMLDGMRSAQSEFQYSYKASPERYAEKTGNLKSFVYEHIKNKGASSEKKYRTLDYMIYAGNRYMVLTKDNRKRDETLAKIYEYNDEGMLRYVYLHENDFPLDKDTEAAINDPLQYRFTVERQIDYDFNNRVSRSLLVKSELNKIEKRYAYYINSNNPKYVTTVDGNGIQQSKETYSAYEKDEYENWTHRKVVTSFRRGDREGDDRRELSYYAVDE